MHFYGLYGSEYLVPTNPETLTECLSTKAHALSKTSAFRNYAQRFFGHGLVTQEGDEHKFFRRTYLPVFNQSAVTRIEHLLLGKSQQLVKYIDKKCDSKTLSHIQLAGNPINDDLCGTVLRVANLACMVSVDTAGLMALGVDFGTIDGRDHDILKAFETLFMSNRQKRLAFISHNLLPRWLMKGHSLPVEKEMEKARRLLEDTVQRMVNKKQQDGLTTEFDYHSKLLQTEDLDMAEVVPQIVTIMAAGYETTGSTLAWTLYLLATHLPVQTALRRELNTRRTNQPTGTAGDQISHDYDDLPLLHGVVMETARLYPPFPFLPRKTIQATTIGGHHVPRGVYIGICPIAINYSRHLWGPSADQFCPDRWIDRSDPDFPAQNPLGGSLSAICMMSFGYGARSCVGRALGISLIKRQVATLVDKFHLDREGMHDQPRPAGLFAAGPPDSLQVRFRRI
ncbi:cytochrome P450 [Penicillium herquei]|nr:cytochrome P450 [Penicillium herquei]